jgi:ABC-2 type transport system ATP-binding protein
MTETAMWKDPGRAEPDIGAKDRLAESAAVAVCVSGLWKRYRTTEAVCGISFEVGRGQIYGILGPNGAGKTTTLECVLGLRQPDAGSVRIHGLDPRMHTARVKLLIGAQLEEAALQDKITPRQALDLFGSFYPQSFATGDLLDRFDLEAKADAHFATLSGGQRQRLFLALALVNRPAVLVLDEPTAGLDPASRRELRALIGGLRAEGRTVLLSTHDLEEAAQLCDRVAILDGGRIMAEAPPSELIGRARAAARVIVLTEPPQARAVVDSLPHVEGVAVAGRAWILETRAPNRVLADLVRRADEEGAELVDFELRRPTPEDVFIELTGRPWFSGGDEPGGPS